MRDAGSPRAGPATSGESVITGFMSDHPVRLEIKDDLRRSRLTVGFRLLLAIPHFIWFALWTIVMVAAAIIGWFAALVLGRLPGSLHRFLSAYIRYSTHLYAYIAIVANPYPDFTGEFGKYPVDLHLPDPEAQARWRILLRLILALPALAITAVLGGGGGFSGSTSGRSSNTSASGSATGLLAFVAVLGWFASLVTGRMPRGLRDAGLYGVGYRAQALAYLLLVTPRYPNADPTAMRAGLEAPPLHPVRLVGDADDLRRSRVTVLFRLPLAIPHLVWLVLWGVLATLAAVAQWFVTLFAGRPARSLHRFLTRYVRYLFHVYAFLTIAANPFPGFTGAPGSYPLELELPPPGRQNRWKTGFRIVLAIPASILSSALGGALWVCAILMWFASLATGSAPWGLRNLAAYALRYEGQLYAYLFLLTDAYPDGSPLEGAAATEAAPELAVA